MAVVTYRDVTAIVQVVTLAPAILCALALIRRHGFSLAWWLMSMFTLSRMVGATALLVSIHHPGIGSQITFLISLYLGLSPLVLLCWSMLLRINEQVRHPLPVWVYRIVNFTTLVALGLGIYGSYRITENAFHTGHNVANGFAQAALIIFATVYLGSVLFFLFLVRQVHDVPQRERIILSAVALVIPLLAIRIVYALISDFKPYSSFNIYSGNITIYLCMDVIEEILIVWIFVMAGFLLPPWRERASQLHSGISSLPPLETSSSPSPLKMSHMRQKSMRSSNEVPEVSARTSNSRASTAKGPITWIYYSIADMRK